MTSNETRPPAPPSGASGPPTRVAPTLARLLVAGALALVPAGAARAQKAPASTDTLPLDSTFSHAGPVLRWNVASRALIERTIAARGDRPATPTFYDGNNNSRLYALVAGAQYDALRVTNDPVEAEAAAITAAASVLRTVFPRDTAWITRRRSAEFKHLREAGLSAEGLRAGERTGRKAAARWVQDATAELHVPPWRGTLHGPGRWHGERTAPALAISLGLRPWFLAKRDQFRPPPPPSPDSPGFRAAIVDGSQRDRLQDPRADARDVGLGAERRHALERIAGGIILRRRLSETDAARALMYLNMTLSDATIACWDAKLTYWYPRPSQVDPSIDLSVPLPDFPSYPSAHATLFAAGAAVLGRLVPDERKRSTAWRRRRRLRAYGRAYTFPSTMPPGSGSGRRSPAPPTRCSTPREWTSGEGPVSDVRSRLARGAGRGRRDWTV